MAECEEAKSSELPETHMGTHLSRLHIHVLHALANTTEHCRGPGHRQGMTEQHRQLDRQTPRDLN